MPALSCPGCGGRVRVADRDLGYDVECPTCLAVFEAGAAEGDRDDRPRRRPPAAGPAELAEEARKAVFLPGLASAAVGVLALLFHAADAALMAANPGLLKNNPLVNLGGGAPPPVELILAIKGLQLVYLAVVVAGSFAMMRLRARPLAVAAAVMQLLPVSGACCVLGLPAGVWALVTLNAPAVRDGYEAAARPGPAGGRGLDEWDDR